MEVFVDSSAYVAVKNIDDPHHKASVDILAKLTSAHTPLVTSNYVLAESITVISQKVSHQAAVDFREKNILETRIVRVSDELEDQAFEFFRTLTSKNVSFIDCTSFALMRSLGLTTVFSFDEHFTQYGFKLLK